MPSSSPKALAKKMKASKARRQQLRAGAFLKKAEVKAAVRTAVRQTTARFQAQLEQANLKSNQHYRAAGQVPALRRQLDETRAQLGRTAQVLHRKEVEANTSWERLSRAKDKLAGTERQLKEATNGLAKTTVELKQKSAKLSKLELQVGWLKAKFPGAERLMRDPPGARTDRRGPNGSQ